MTLTDLLPVEGWEAFENDIHNKFGLNAYVYNTDGMSVTDSAKKWANPLCPVIKANKKSLTFICAVANQHLAKEAIRKRSPVIGECDAGLLKVAVPILVSDAFLGVVGGCGHVFDHSEVESFLIHKISGIDEQKIERLSRDIPRVADKDIERLVQFIQARVDSIVSRFRKN